MNMLSAFHDFLIYEHNIIYAPCNCDIINWFIFVDDANITASHMSERMRGRYLGVRSSNAITMQRFSRYLAMFK